jgi:hypothetical protein
MLRAFLEWLESDQQMERERRDYDRSIVLQTVHIVFEGATIRGAVLDLSMTGARVCLPAGAQVPDLVLLYLLADAVRAARVRWREGSDVGFEFLATD